MILKAVKTEHGVEYRDAGIRGTSFDGVMHQIRGEASIEQLKWANEMMRREIWTLKKRLAQYE